MTEAFLLSANAGASSSAAIIPQLGRRWGANSHVGLVCAVPCRSEVAGHARHEALAASPRRSPKHRICSITERGQLVTGVALGTSLLAFQRRANVARDKTWGALRPRRLTVRVAAAQEILAQADMDPPTEEKVLAPGSGSSSSSTASAPSKCDIVQFDAAIYYVEEIENLMTIDVMRIGRLNEYISVDYTTEDDSAKAGVRYEKVSGTLQFEPGETNRIINVPILDGGRWNTTLEFKIRLFNPVNCELGRFLFLCRVKVIDKDFFPTNRFAKEMRMYGAGNLEQAGITGIDLFMEWCKFNFSFGDIAKNSTLTLLVDQLSNINFLLGIYLVQYIADDVLGSKPERPLLIEGNYEQTVIAVAALYFTPMAILVVLELWKARMEIAEQSRARLQENIFRKFMNYNSTSRAAISTSEVCLAMVQDVSDMVDSGYMNIFALVKNMGKLVFSSYFIVSESPEAVLPLAVFSLGTVAYVAVRYEDDVRLREEVSDEQASILGVVQEGSLKYQLVADYFLRPQLQKSLDSDIQRLNAASVEVAISGVVNEYFPVLLSTALVTGWIALGGEGVLKGTMQVGTFLATINVFKEVGSSFQDIFAATLNLSKAIGPAQKLTYYLNLETDLREKKANNRARRKTSKVLRQPSPRTPNGFQEVSCYTDDLSIALEGVSFRYPGTERDILQNLNLNCPQGEVVGIVGPRIGGKSTFMKILGLALAPTEGIYFVPSHLRVLHVPETPMMLRATVWENLVLARQYWTDPEFESQRVIKICHRIGLSDSFCRLLEDTREDFLNRTTSSIGAIDGQIDSWQRQLSFTDTLLVHLARAFIYSPEVMVMNRPVQSLSDPCARRVRDMIREFVNHRGVELPASDFSMRRKRTAFVSFVRPEGISYADRIWQVSRQGVQEIPKEAVLRTDFA